MLNDPRHEAAAPFVPGRVIGVEVKNHGPVGAGVRTAGAGVSLNTSPTGGIRSTAAASEQEKGHSSGVVYLCLG